MSYKPHPQSAAYCKKVCDEAQARRVALLARLPPTFTTTEAQTEWNLTYRQTTSLLDYLRAYFLITSSGPRNCRIHVKEES